MSTVQNKPATVSNDLTERVINIVAAEATQEVFEAVIKLEYISDISNDLTALLATELRNASFMTVNLDLSDDQREKLADFVGKATIMARDKYLANLKKDERTKKIIGLVEKKMQAISEETMSAIAQEVNRGAIIASTAVSANAKKDDFNTIEIQYGKAAGDITIPTRGVFISTNCVRVVQDSCRVSVINMEPAEAQAEAQADAA